MALEVHRRMPEHADAATGRKADPRMAMTAPYGDFRAATLVGLLTAQPQALVADDGFLELPLAEIVPYGSFRDDNGELYSFVRRQWPGAADDTGRIVAFSTKVDGAALRL